MIEGTPESLARRMEALGIDERDLEEQFVRSSGPGGQNVNKVSTCVQLRHRPTGHSVSVESTRSQSANRILARERLCSLFETEAARLRLERALRRRRQRLAHAGRPHKVKEKILKAKRHRSETKRDRRHRPDAG